MALFFTPNFIWNKMENDDEVIELSTDIPRPAALKPVRYNTTRGDLNQINGGEKKNGTGIRTEKYDGSFRPVQFRGGFFIDEYPVLCK